MPGAGKIADREPTSGRETGKCRLVAAIGVALWMSRPGMADAGNAYDGEWHGRVQSTDDRHCQSGSATLSVHGRQVSGLVTLGDNERSVLGTVADNGEFGGTIGFQHITGKFGPEKFAGIAQGVNCTWTLSLDRVEGPGR